MTSLALNRIQIIRQQAQIGFLNRACAKRESYQRQSTVIILCKIYIVVYLAHMGPGLVGVLLV